MSFPLPYYAVIFTSLRSEADEGYSEMAGLMEEMCRQQPGFLGMDHARNEIGITVCYWQTLEDIANWKNNATHKEAQRLGIEKWYKNYNVKICKVEREYEG